MTDQLIPAVDIEHLFAQRNAMLEHAKAATAALEKLIKTYEDTKAVIDASGCAYSPYINLQHDFGLEYRSALNDWHRFRARVDGAFWKWAARASGAYSLMSAAKREEFDKSVTVDSNYHHTGVDADTIPEFTRENLEGMLINLHGQATNLEHEAVIEVYRGLNWDYQMNQPRAFGLKMKLTGAGSSWRFDLGSCALNDRAEAKLQNLERLLHRLDGKPEPTHAQALGRKIQTESKKDAHGRWHYEDELFKVKLFKNRNMDLEFKRPDLIEKLNKLLAEASPNHLPAKG